MARDKKTEAYKNIDAKDLPELSPQVIDFIEYYMFDASVFLSRAMVNILIL